jgi:malate synthase
VLSHAEAITSRGVTFITVPADGWKIVLNLLPLLCSGVHAMGGMAAQIPIKDNKAANDAAMAKV